MSVDATPPPAPETVTTPDHAAVQTALARARRVLEQTQRDDGSWDAPGDMGPSPTAQVLVALHFIGRLDPRDAEDGARWLRSQQSPDGSFIAHPFATVGDLGATACALAALHVTAPGDSADAISRAGAWIDARGGTAAVVRGMDSGDVSALFLGMARLVDAKQLPCPPLFPFLFSAVVKFLETRFHAGILMVAEQTGVLVRWLRGDYGSDGTSRGLLDRPECAALVSLLETFQNHDGSWNGNTVQGALALPALFAAGLPVTDARIARGVAWLEGQKVRTPSGLKWNVFGSGVWSTAFDVRALLAAGVPRSDANLGRALTWLVDSQFDTPQPAVDNRHEGAPRTGGWGFQRGNHTMADSDDAGVVLGTLGLLLESDSEGVGGAVNDGLAQRTRAAIDRGREWVLGMQNPDGGWSAFVYGLPGKPPGPIMERPLSVSMTNPLAALELILHPPPDLGDPSTEDLTGRVLYGLGRIGLTSANSPAVRRAVDFLRKQQCDTGAFWGRWVVNYLSSTAFVLLGLASIGEDLDASWVQRAVKWVVSRQNADGGFGEAIGSYRDPSQAGVGASTPPLTGLVVLGLVAVGEGSSPAVARAIGYLLAMQHADGTWPNCDYLHTNIPPDSFYYLSEAARFYPTEALGRYLTHKRVTPTPPAARWGDAVLDPFRQKTDPVADALVQEIYADGDVAAVNDLLAKIFRSDEPIPAGLPAKVATYFEATSKLPDWADPARLAIAEQLFTRYGWQVAMALFCSSLPQAYAAANGAAVLIQTQAMTRHVRQRIFETGQFIFDTMDVQALGPNGRGIRAAQKVRLMHAGVRQLILHRQGTAWDASTFGLPINQEDMAGTLMTFSCVTLDVLKRLHLPFTSEEGEAWMHAWTVVAHVLGIDPDLYPKDLADGEALMEAIRRRQWAPSDGGRALTNALVEMMQSYFPEKALDGVPTALIRILAGDECGDLLGLPPTDWTRLLIDAATEVEAIVLGSARQTQLDALFSLAAHRFEEGVVLAEREGKQARFRIPDALKHTVDPND